MPLRSFMCACVRIRAWFCVYTRACVRGFVRTRGRGCVRICMHACMRPCVCVVCVRHLLIDFAPSFHHIFPHHGQVRSRKHFLQTRTFLFALLALSKQLDLTAHCGCGELGLNLICHHHCFIWSKIFCSTVDTPDPTGSVYI